MDGSPAQKAGLRPSDIILKVDGESVAGLPLDQVVSRILGPAGTSVVLTIMDPDTGRTRDVTIVRAHIKIQNVTWQRLPGTTVAHVRIAAFSQGVTEDLRGALEDIPLVVLINGGTASAAEIVAGALQDAQRATLVGETTFGTGTVLNEFRLSDGSALLLATEEWLTPGGRVIWHQGISPDKMVSLSSGVAPLLPEAEREMTAAQLQASEDAQLLQALELLKQLSAARVP